MENRTINNSNPDSFFTEWKIKLTIFIAVFAVLFSARATQIYDSQFLFLTSYTVYHDQSLNIRPYIDFQGLRETVYKLMPTNVYVKNVDGVEQWRYGYPNLNAYLSIPYVFIMDKLGYKMVAGNPQRWWLANETYLQKIYCAILMALYAVILFQLARLWLNTQLSVLVVIVLTFGSSIASVLSRALWMDTYASFFLLLAIYHLAKNCRRPEKLNLFFLIATTAVSIMCKPTYAIPALSVILWSLIINYRKTILVIVGCVFVAIGGALYNYLIQGSILGNYHFGSFDGFSATRIVGLLISPARGMFVYWSWAFFLFCLLGVFYKKLLPEEKTLIKISLLPLILTIVLLSFFWFWHGGPGYGPRLLIPAMPWLFLVLIILINTFYNSIISSKNNLENSENRQITIKPAYKTLIIIGLVTSLWAIMVNIFGANQNKAHDQWYRLPLEGKTIDSRMWDWSDPPFLAGYIKPERYFKYSIELSAPPTSEEAIPTELEVQKMIRKNLEKQNK